MKNLRYTFDKLSSPEKRTVIWLFVDDTEKPEENYVILWGDFLRGTTEVELFNLMDRIMATIARVHEAQGIETNIMQRLTMWEDCAAASRDFPDAVQAD